MYYVHKFIVRYQSCLLNAADIIVNKHIYMLALCLLFMLPHQHVRLLAQSVMKHKLHFLSCVIPSVVSCHCLC